MGKQRLQASKLTWAEHAQQCTWAEHAQQCKAEFYQMKLGKWAWNWNSRWIAHLSTLFLRDTQDLV